MAEMTAMEQRSVEGKASPADSWEKSLQVDKISTARALTWYNALLIGGSVKVPCGRNSGQSRQFAMMQFANDVRVEDEEALEGFEHKTDKLFYFLKR